MSDLFCFLDGFGAGSPAMDKSILIVTAPTGATLTATLGDTVKTAAEKTPGEYWLRNLDVGEWNLKLTKDEQVATEKYNIQEFGVYRLTMDFYKNLEFTYTGDYECVQDDDTPIEDFASWKGDWNIRLLTSGNLTIVKKNNTDKIDVFGVGGGSTATKSTIGSLWRAKGATPSTSYGISISEDTYEISIGAGGVGESYVGGDTNAFGLTWNGDDSEFQNKADYNEGEYSFEGDTSSTIRYGGNMEDETPPPENTGKGSCNGEKNTPPPPGASGIVIIRNARRTA